MSREKPIHIPDICNAVIRRLPLLLVFEAAAGTPSCARLRIVFQRPHVCEAVCSRSIRMRAAIEASTCAPC